MLFENLLKPRQRPSATSKQCFEQPTASFLVCFLIFIDYKHKKTQTDLSEFFMILSFWDNAGLSLS